MRYGKWTLQRKIKQINESVWWIYKKGKNMSKQHWRYMNFKNWYPLEWRNALRSYAANTQTNQIASVYSRGNRANTSNWLGIVLQQNNGDLSPAFLQQASARLESIDCVGRRDYQNYARHHPCHGDQLQPAPFLDAAENIWRLQHLNNLLAEARILTLLAAQQQAKSPRRKGTNS